MFWICIRFRDVSICICFCDVLIFVSFGMCIDLIFWDVCIIVRWPVTSTSRFTGGRLTVQNHLHEVIVNVLPQRLRHDVSELILCAHSFDFDRFVFDVILDELASDLDVFRSPVRRRMIDERFSSCWIRVNDSWTFLRCTITVLRDVCGRLKIGARLTKPKTAGNCAE